MESISRKYVNVCTLKRLLYILSAISCALLIFMQYDVEFKGVIVFPICYSLCIFLFVQEKYVTEIGSIFLSIMYGFRMCVLPVLCAYGNFYLEPDKSLYIEQYPATILLTCVECIAVFACLFFWGKYYFGNNACSNIKKANVSGGVINAFLLLLLLVIMALFCIYPGLVGRFGTIFSEPKTVELQEYGTVYYLSLLIDVIGRPLLIFSIVEFLLKKNTTRCSWMAVFVSALVVFITSDRRIYSLLIGGVCLLHIMVSGRIKIKRKYMYAMLVVLAVATLFLGFYGEDTPFRIARKFQRYFSGPTLTAIGLEVNEQYNQGIGTLLSLVFNCSIILGGVFGNIPVKNYVMEICGVAGESIWTPMTVGALQYVGWMFPVLLWFIVWFVVYCDYKSRESYQLKYIMIYSFLSVAISIYMIMYTIELILYNILFIGLFYFLLIFLDKKYRLKLH